MMKFKHIAMIQWLPVTIWWWLQWYVQYSLVLVEKTKHLTLEEIFSCWSVLSWEGWLLYKSDWWVEETGLESKCAEIQLGPTLVQCELLYQGKICRKLKVLRNLWHTQRVAQRSYEFCITLPVCCLAQTETLIHRNSAWPESMQTGCSILRERERAQLGLDTVQSQSHHLC